MDGTMAVSISMLVSIILTIGGVLVGFVQWVRGADWFAPMAVATSAFVVLWMISLSVIQGI